MVQVPLLPAPVWVAPLVITAGVAVSPSDWLKDALWCERVETAFEGRRAATSCSDGLGNFPVAWIPAVGKRADPGLEE